MDTPESLHQQLTDNGYELVAKFTFREMLEPVREGFKTKNKFTTGFRISIFILLMITTALGAWYMVSKQLSFTAWLGYTALGVPLTLLLIPFHEWIHGIAFKAYGAKDVRYGVIWRYLMFYAVSHMQLLGARQYYRIGLAPFVVITFVAFAVLPFCDPVRQAIVMGILCFHSLCCIGDFGLCAYFAKYIDRHPLTFDDAVTGTSYIYLKRSVEY
ncbi:DUF3267 domain-containing protein [uncultured Chitinophaga sp.]|uniref:DUF3267 domain-containing protein n=1 Tax=uncultured Chitinophaga sp. TaxID=339340 RepID=UPI0025D4DD5C|nr:DUF3267 domain-containing protein [uncultured Chitinophaga sp.]